MSSVVFPFVSQVMDVVPKCSMVAPPYAFKIAGDGSRTPGLGKPSAMMVLGYICLNNREGKILP